MVAPKAPPVGVVLGASKRLAASCVVSNTPALALDLAPVLEVACDEETGWDVGAFKVVLIGDRKSIMGDGACAGSEDFMAVAVARTGVVGIV